MQLCRWGDLERQYIAKIMPVRPIDFEYRFIVICTVEPGLDAMTGQIPFEAIFCNVPNVQFLFVLQVKTEAAGLRVWLADVPA